jgi:putative ABC transport system permease protein
MRYYDLFEETYTALSANKVRSGLTILGIVIGIGSVIAMVSIGQGAQKSISDSIQSAGSNLILVYPGSQRGPGSQVSSGQGSARTLKASDARALEEITGVKAVSPELTQRYQIVAAGANTNSSVVGIEPAYADVRKVTVREGSFITDSHISSRARVAVIGPTVATTLFGEESPLGKTLRIKNNNFKIIGVTNAKGGTGFTNQDDMVFVPLTSAQQFLVGDDYISSMSIESESSEIMTELQTSITNVMLEQHKISDPSQPDFTVLNQADILATASSITQTFTLLLAAIAGISLLVGGIGIMNMMLTTVTERTKEIGLRKAIGATEKNIQRQFLAEAIVLTSLGGITGIILGAGASYSLAYFGILSTSVSIQSILLATGVSAAIGIIFGYYPARRASRLNPIEALRYE